MATPNNPMENKTLKYLVWSIEHSAWWKPHASGYTIHRSKAGRFSLKEAIGFCGEHVEDIPKEAIVPLLSEEL